MGIMAEAQQGRFSVPPPPEKGGTGRGRMPNDLWHQLYSLKEQ